VADLAVIALASLRRRSTRRWATALASTT